jgi:hypothetical protein
MMVLLLLVFVFLVLGLLLLSSALVLALRLRVPPRGIQYTVSIYTINQENRLDSERKKRYSIIWEQKKTGMWNMCGGRFCDEMRRRGGADVGGSFCVACLAVCHWCLIPERPTTTGKRCTTSMDTAPSYSIQCTVCCGKRDVFMVCNQEGYFGRGSRIVLPGACKWLIGRGWKQSASQEPAVVK